ncbi:MAG: glycosyltransferase [Bacteroides sp.]|nr:glycosyltransferase [Bacteroides sp.]
MQESRVYAPVAMFVYNRLSNTRNTFEHLKKNLYADQTALYIFSDGGKDERSRKEVQKVRKYLRTVSGFKEIHLVERECNYYLERNVIEGIHEVIGRYGRVIVLEDDIATSPWFLKYMNDALEFYKEDKKVMHIAGFTNLHLENKGDTYFTPHMSGYGWATWSDRWKHFRHYSNREETLAGLSPEELERIEYDGAFPCLRSLDRRPIPWDICWELTIYKQKGLCLTPTRSLVRNTGIYSGTHFRHYKILGRYNYDRPFYDREMRVNSREIKADPEIEELYKEAFRDHGMRYTLLGKIARYFYLRFIKKSYK